MMTQEAVDAEVTGEGDHAIVLRQHRHVGGHRQVEAQVDLLIDLCTW